MTSRPNGSDHIQGQTVPAHVYALGQDSMGVVDLVVEDDLLGHQQS